jgi:hypothetical protein
MKASIIIITIAIFIQNCLTSDYLMILTSRKLASLFKITKSETRRKKLSHVIQTKPNQTKKKKKKKKMKLSPIPPSWSPAKSAI